MKIDLIDKRALEQIQVDAFVTGEVGRTFTGNPAAVVFRQGSARWMQSIANENNLSETAFVQFREVLHASSSSSSSSSSFSSPRVHSYGIRW